jgi:hypothetical protein
MEPDAPHDLRAFFKAVGRFSGEHADMTSVPDRDAPDDPAEELDPSPLKVTADPLAVDGFVDGIQASLVVTYRAHRPVFLSYVAAGAVGPGAKPLGLRERLAIVASSEDREWVDSVRQSLPVEELSAVDPPDVQRDASSWLGSTRESLERAVVADLTEREAVKCLAVDGTLLGRPHSTRLVGVVKTTRRRYLADESCLFGLPAGWRSPRFRIDPSSAGPAPARYSCYLRLHDASASSWDHALIRLEAFDPDQLDGLAARCLVERQVAAGGDRRWDRHLASVRACEEFLRARRPAVFSLST